MSGTWWWAWLVVTESAEAKALGGRRLAGWYASGAGALRVSERTLLDGRSGAAAGRDTRAGAYKLSRRRRAGIYKCYQVTSCDLLFYRPLLLAWSSKSLIYHGIRFFLQWHFRLIAFYYLLPLKPIMLFRLPNCRGIFHIVLFCIKLGLGRWILCHMFLFLRTPFIHNNVSEFKCVRINVNYPKIIDFPSFNFKLH